LDDLRPEYDVLDLQFFQKFADPVAKNQPRSKILNLHTANWSMLLQSNYVERDQQWELLEKTLRLSSHNGVSLLLIRGEPGAGKSALLRWVAYELFQQDRRVLHKKSQDRLGWLEQLQKLSEAVDGAHFYVIVDDLFRDRTILDELLQSEFLFPLTLIATTRQNEDLHAELDGTGYEIICLDLAKPSTVEKERILALPEVQSSLQGKSQAELQALIESPIMLVLMLQLSKGKTFELILQDIVKTLLNREGQPLYEVFGVVCCFSQYGIIVPFEILRLCLPNFDCSERLIMSGLAGLVDTATYGGYEGLMAIHELIAKKVMELSYRPNELQNRPYSSFERPPLLERHLRAVVPNLDGSAEIHKRWLYHSLKLLAVNGQKDLVCRILQDYGSQVEAIQQENSIADWTYWSRLYKLIDLKDRQDFYINKILQMEPETQHEWRCWLRFVVRVGSDEDKQLALKNTQTRLLKYPQDVKVRIQYLVLVERLGKKDKQLVLKGIQAWLLDHPHDVHVRRQYLVSVERFGSKEDKQLAFKDTQTWLSDHPHDGHVLIKYLVLVERFGSDEDKQLALKNTQTWLIENPHDMGVRVQYLACLGKTSNKDDDIQDLVHEQQQWIAQQKQVEQNLWVTFLPVLYHHGASNLYQQALHLALQQYPDHFSINNSIFGYFRDYIDYDTCYRLAEQIRQVHLPPYMWQNRIHAANFFRDHGELKITEEIYKRVLSAAKNKLDRYPNLQKTIDLANLSYSRLLLITEPPQLELAMQKLQPILTKNPKHGYAHLLMAQAYQTSSSYTKAEQHFRRAIQYDQQKSGVFYYEFGCFYRHVVDNTQQARHCFEQSITQKPNLPAYIELAELEAEAGNKEIAQNLLQAGLELALITRPEKEQREKLSDRITTLQSSLNLT